MNEEIKKFAYKLGFHLVSIIPAEPTKEDGKYLNDWIDSGFAADLEYMKKDVSRRSDPSKSLPEAKSIICLGMNYYQKREDSSSDLKVARYAWGKDYHSVVEKKLKKLRTFIIENCSSNLSKKDFKLYSDAGPILERAYAARASLGFIGKNTTLITKEYGSWVFLAEIITTLELKYDERVTSKISCGTCTRCIDACPVKALSKPYTVDANKCISYQTIEKKGPVDINTSGNVFGCDICQEVCPHNCRAKQTDIEEFTNHRAGPNLNHEEILNMTEEEFAEKYKGSPIKRAGLKKLKSTIKNMLSS
jgi:epoxyqueuosine reductase